MDLGQNLINRWFAWGISVTLFILFAHPATATMYRCFDAAGTMVLTDTPAQLEDCTVLDPQKPHGQITKDSHRTSQRRARSRPRRAEPPPHQVVAPPQEDFPFEAEEEPPPEKKTEPITVPVTKIGGSIVVQVLLNGSVDAHLIVDTGATMTVLSYDLGIELGLLSGSDVSLNTVNTAGGSVQVSVTRVGTLQVGSAKATNVAVAIHDLPDAISGVSGLLGMSFLKNFEVTLDADRGILRLLPKS